MKLDRHGDLPFDCAAYDTPVRALRSQSVLLVLCACIAVFLAAAAEPASGVSERTITITLLGSGKALWKLDNSREHRRLALDYHWHGRLRFAVGVPLLNDPAHKGLSVRSNATLVAGWTGHSSSTKLGETSSCKYGGVKVRARITAKLAKGRAGNTLEVILHPRTAQRGFFSDLGHGATVRCSSSYGALGPSHFAPSWFFRDNLQDHGRLSSETAIIVLPSALLPRGSATVAFPKETGRNNSVALGRIAWSNRAETAVRTY
jgi:hypothetical protein